MTDISNRVLSTVIIASIFLTVWGIFSIPSGGVTIVGQVTNITLGTTQVEITQTIQIRLNNNTVDFGTGFVNSSGNNCTLTSNSATKNAPCQGFNAPALDAHFTIENIGNANVSLQINGTYANARAFLCNAASSTQNCTFANPEYIWQSANIEAGSCTGAGASANLNTTPQTVCTNLDFNSTANEVAVALQVVIPRDSRKGTLNDTVLFTATT